MREGYASFLLDGESARRWLRRAKGGTRMPAWFSKAQVAVLVVQDLAGAEAFYRDALGRPP